VDKCKLLDQWDSFAREMSELRDKIVPWFNLNYIFCLHKFCEFLKNKEIKNKIWNWIIQHFCLDSVTNFSITLCIFSKDLSRRITKKILVYWNIFFNSLKQHKAIKLTDFSF
jgi:hypothetical protein